jgi:hypothetical protein
MCAGRHPSSGNKPTIGNAAESKPHRVKHRTASNFKFCNASDVFRRKRGGGGGGGGGAARRSAESRKDGTYGGGSAIASLTRVDFDTMQWPDAPARVTMPPRLQAVRE